MEQEELKNLIIERLNNLQPEIREAIQSSNYEKELYDISQKHKLSIAQMKELEADTTLLMIGHFHPDEYPIELEKDLSLPAEKIEEITNDVNERVLKNIRELIKQNFAREDQEQQDFNEIPLPPSAASTETLITTQNPTPQKASGIYASAGIEIMDEPDVKEKAPDETAVTNKEGNILEKSGINVIPEKKIPEAGHVLPTAQTQKDTLAGIEHPEDVATSIIKDKLGGTIIGNVTKTNYSLPKMSAQTPATNAQPQNTTSVSKPHDPYHEAIE